jgi:hypothetical protein
LSAIVFLLSAAPAQGEPLSNLIEQLRRKGMSHLFFAEVHYDPDNVHTITALLRGAKRVGALRYWAEQGHAPGREVEIANLLDDDSRRGTAGLRVITTMFMRRGMDRDALLARPEVSEYADQILDERISLAPFFFYTNGRKDMSAFLASPGFAIAHTGAAHAEYVYNASVPGFNVPWEGLTLPLNPSHKKLNSETLADGYAGFSRALAQGHQAALVRLESNFRSEMAPSPAEAAYYAHYARLGMPVTRIGLEHGLSAIVVMSPGLLPHIAGYLETTGSSATTNCAGIPGCPINPPQERDEL